MCRRRDWPFVVLLLILWSAIGAIFLVEWLFRHRVEIATVLRAWGIG